MFQPGNSGCLINATIEEVLESHITEMSTNSWKVRINVIMEARTKLAYNAVLLDTTEAILCNLTTQ